MRKFIKHNGAFLLIVIILTTLFWIVVHRGENQIYEKEAKWQYESTISQLLTAEEIIRVQFHDFERVLFLLKSIPNTRSYVNTNFESVSYKNKVKEIFFELAKVFKHFYKIRIIDSSGQEIIKVARGSDGTAIIAPGSQLQNKRNRYYFQEAMKMDENQIYVSPIDLNIENGKIEMPYTPVIRLATPLFDSKGEKRGILVLSVEFSKVLELLPKNVFIQTEDGYLISSNSDKSVNFRKSDYNFPDDSGHIELSDIETIHYSTVDFLPGNRLIVASYHKHPTSKAALQNLTLISMLIFILFLVLMFAGVYLDFSKSRDLLGAQKAIMSSLATLAERRDTETGRHLKRTREYAVILTKQLRKNKKYRKIITNEFIENLYDTAPLHDMGKVGIRDSILLKEGKLTKEEYEEIKKHTIIGKQIIQDVIGRYRLKGSYIIMARNICAYHHEKHNGEGYPEGLKGEKIPLEARIFALCDAYDAIRSKRPYKDELPHEEAIRRIKADRGKHFDPDIVDAFLECEKEFERVYETYKYDQGIGFVI
ncbi:HD domain-containing phosphohydrolase [Kosmotoga olearia]|uniref:Metal dependent phosphohydrolase n=1 Tax=Kosmotoga olearia (strain ATCC BAA-1733 / DSM 21960 / TBF 19.5.1) TaxID=521045 RepID=C5CHX1_KOSOT|nr:HD domain-containing phosphohydrolase [Kosmotoga olearia]ACR78826.1 metal dependent phosphohydrolase [Kosmotoga olearia TBF 19.5.1]